MLGAGGGVSLCESSKVGVVREHLPSDPLPKDAMIIEKGCLSVGSWRNGVKETVAAVKAKFLKPVGLGESAKASSGNSQSLTVANSGNELDCFPTSLSQQSLATMAIVMGRSMFMFIFFGGRARN
jgi:hypothetical protein